MTELKTLKDIEVHEADEEDLTNNVEWFKQEIKAEAIKWLSQDEGKPYNSHNSQDGFIMEFFNITEEDLVPIEKRELVPIK